MVNPIFTWIHLSDIHVGHGDSKHAQDQLLVLNALKIDIQGAPNRGVPKPDVIFVTGDLAFSGDVLSKNEYKRVDNWLKEIAESVSIKSTRIFVVPGNHDVQRNVEESDTNLAQVLKLLRSGEEQIDNILGDVNKSALLAKRMENYLNFAKHKAPANCHPESQRAKLFWSYLLTLNDWLTIRLVGLNTTLLTAKEEDEFGDFKRLQLGKGQLVQAFTSPPINEYKEIVIALSHHPFSWLRDELEVSPAVKRYAHIHLCGHVHNAESERHYSGSGKDIVSIVSGATHNEAEPAHVITRHGYNYASIWIRDDGQFVLRTWPRLWSKHHEFRVDYESVPTVHEHGQSYHEDFVDHELRFKISGRSTVEGGPVTSAPAASQSGTFQQIKMEELKKRRAILLKQYKAVNHQLAIIMDNAQRVLLREQLKSFEQEIVELEDELKKI
jgi:predicted MPP superfamily phosphohydrolase